MSDAGNREKHQLRQHCLQIRENLSEAQRLESSVVICDLIRSWVIFAQSEIVSAYMPMRGEVDITPLFEKYPKKKWVLPRISVEPVKRMLFHEYVSDALVRHPYGMLEPAAGCMLVPYQEIQLALVPGLAFDRRGWRLGYGGGYYDRFLRSSTGVSLGLTYSALLLDALPRQAHDVAMDYVVTEAGLMKTALAPG